MLVTNYTPTLNAGFDVEPSDDLNRLMARQERTADHDEWLARSLDRWQDRRFHRISGRE
jgi:hypothetical protein